MASILKSRKYNEDKPRHVVHSAPFCTVGQRLANIKTKMAAASDKDLTSCVELQQNLKGVKVGLPNLSTLAQKGNEQVSLFSLICSFLIVPALMAWPT